MRSPLLAIAALAISLPAVVVGACASPGATGSPAPVSPVLAPMSPVTSPTPVPVATPLVTPSPSPRPGAGLGCGEPIGAADEIVIVGSVEDPNAIVVDAIRPDGTRTVLLEGLRGPRDPVFDAQGNLYIAETDGGRILKLSGDF